MLRVEIKALAERGAGSELELALSRMHLACILAPSCCSQTPGLICNDIYRYIDVDTDAEIDAGTEMDS